jgi:hypothetical protein
VYYLSCACHFGNGCVCLVEPPVLAVVVVCRVVAICTAPRIPLVSIVKPANSIGSGNVGCVTGVSTTVPFCSLVYLVY